MARPLIGYDRKDANRRLLLPEYIRGWTTQRRQSWMRRHGIVPAIGGAAQPPTYIAFNGAVNTTAAPVKVATGASIKTLLQIATPATTAITIIEWGISFDAASLAAGGAIELLQTDVAATSGTSVTPTLWGDPNAPASLCVGGTGATCFSPSVEGSITATRMFDLQLLPPVGYYYKQFPLGREPMMPVSKFLRVRVTMPATVSAYCYVIWAE
jgi:hypothetical protein